MFCSFYKSTIGKKIIVALTGLFLIGFVVGHMAGNLKFFASPDPVSGQPKLDHYGHLLRTLGADFIGNYTFLWVFRILLILALLAHVVTVILLCRQNKIAKSTDYANPTYKSSTLASRYMLYGGLTLLAFIIFHILHFTTGDLHFQGFVFGNVFNNVISGFSVWYVTAFYVIAMSCLGLHLYHGAWSMFQTLGVDNPNWNTWLRLFAKILAIVVFIGFVSVPLCAFFGNYSYVPPR